MNPVYAALKSKNLDTQTYEDEMNEKSLQETFDNCRETFGTE